MEKERKQQIIKAADKRFSKHGLGKTTLDEIARDLRIGKATIYHYFQSKEELFYDTIQWETGQIIEDIKNIFNNEQKDVAARFVDYFNFKETIASKYKLVYEVFVMLLKDEIYEKEAQLLSSLIKKEEEILNLAINSLFAGKIENMKPGLPFIIVMESWGALSSNKLSMVINRERDASIKENLYKFLIS